MTDLREQIESLDDVAACRILAAVAQAQVARETVETAWTETVAAAVTGAFGPAMPATAPAHEGDLARAALLVLAGDPRHAEAIRALVAGPEARSFGLVEIGVLTAALVALQTRVKFTRDKDGKFALVIDKAAASDGLLKALVEKLLSFVPGRPPADR